MSSPHALMVKREDTGELIEAQSTAAGALKTEAVGGTAPPSVTAFNTSFAIQQAVSNVPFKLRGLCVYVKSSGLITIHNKITVVANGDQPYASFIFSVAGGQHYSLPLPADGLDLDTGCQVAFVSSIGAGTEPQVTLGTAQAMFFAQGDPIV